MEIDKARLFLKSLMVARFTDKTFGDYIDNTLAGDFAAELADAVSVLADEHSAEEQADFHIQTRLTLYAEVDRLIAEISRLTALCDGYRGEIGSAQEPPTCFDDWWKSTKYGLPHWGQPHIFMPLDIGRDSFAAGYRMGKKERQSSHPRTHHQGDSDES